jgi:adenylate kinase family enzyme
MAPAQTSFRNVPHRRPSESTSRIPATDVKRIVVTGPAGAGKSELASRLSERLGIRVVHLDTLFWKPGWVATPEAEWEALQRSEVEAPEWIVDSQADDMIPDWLEAADAVVVVDTSPFRCLWRVVRRRRNRDSSVGVPAQTQPGPVHWALMKFARNQWLYRRRVRGELMDGLAARRDDRRVVIVRGTEDAAAFLDSL